MSIIDFSWKDTSALEKPQKPLNIYLVLVQCIVLIHWLPVSSEIIVRIYCPFCTNEWQWWQNNNNQGKAGRLDRDLKDVNF